MLELKLILLLVIANGTPVMIRRWWHQHWAMPIDGGLVWRDGRPLFGRSKTWRGLIGAILMTTIGARLLGLNWGFGACFGALAMLGDLFSSFCKRRLGIAPSGKASGLDQVPESALPGAFAMKWLDLGWESLLIVTLGFCALEMLISPLLFQLGLRRRPY